MMIEKICQTCGNSFSVPHWRPNAKYCCTTCRQEGLKAKPNIICPCCGKAFHLKASYVSRYKGAQGFFCSKECAKMGMRERMTGQRNHQYGLKGIMNASFKGAEITHKNHNVIDIREYSPEHPYKDKDGRVLKHRLVVEANYRMFDASHFLIIDGKYYLKREYNVHHLDGNHNNNDINNLMIVTRSQHTTIHNRERMIIRDTKTGRITGVVKLGELLGSPEVGNQQPSISSNAFEGSETNSRLLMDKAKEGNADKSAQHPVRMKI